ncbi:MAG: type I-E CRISPR-associated protein Cas6/Cse3/CasE [Thiotrichaceae bacterium]|nr:type I-E CRISPR-associated protein Cas6/Cse3/CasE [Thiotrichaceae bacterium]
MYLSRVYVQWPKSKNAYTLHQSLWELFPNRPNEKRDFLFRVEQEKTGVGVSVLMQSQQEPALDIESVELKAKRDYSLDLHEGQCLRFLLKANPVKTIKDEKGRKNSKGEVRKCRVPLIKEEEQLQWLKQKLDGIAILKEIQISPCLPLYFLKQGRAGKVVPLKFEGLVTVADPVAFSALLENGVGPAKSLGCGMLSLAPAG